MNFYVYAKFYVVVTFLHFSKASVSVGFGDKFLEYENVAKD